MNLRQSLCLTVCLIGLAGVIHAQSMAYVLQADAFANTRAGAIRQLADSGRDLVVIDSVFDGSAAGPWTRAEIRAIRAGKTGRKVVAYLSIGEVEDYRPYWQAAWDANQDGQPDAGAPAFLGDVNPDWPGNYRVRYWQPAWQSLVLGMLDGIAAKGFDGVYLDIVDAFETWEYDPDAQDWIENRMNPETGRTYRRDMILWVKAIAARARRAHPGFLVIPQNGSPLLRAKGFRNVISGIGIEDLFTEGNALQPAGHVNPILADLALLAEGKPVWLIEYGSRIRARTASQAGAEAHGFSLLLTDRELKTLGVCPNP